MKILYLMRHVESAWRHSDKNDFDISLTMKGEKEADLVGRFLVSKKIKPELIITSPAKRAFATAQTVANAISYASHSITTNNHIYGASIKDLLYVIHKIPDDIQSVLIVGHNPAISHLVTYLTTQKIEVLPTGSLCKLTFENRVWTEINRRTGEFIFLKMPFDENCA